MEFKKYGRGDLDRFFRRIDSLLAEDCTVVVIGGAVAVFLGHFVSTGDIDVWSADEAFWRVCEGLRDRAEYVPVYNTPVAQAPFDFEDRLVRFEGLALSKLTIATPEIHDWAISKIARGVEHDLQQIEWVHRTKPLVLDTLVERFLKTDYIGRPRDFELSFLALVDRLFGSSVVAEVEVRIGARSTS